MCDLSVHQACYGISSQAPGNWICSVCAKFGEQGERLRCPFCCKRGGAMKPSQVKANTNFFQTLNPSYHNYLKICMNMHLGQYSQMNKDLEPSRESQQGTSANTDIESDPLQSTLIAGKR